MVLAASLGLALGMAAFALLQVPVLAPVTSRNEALAQNQRGPAGDATRPPEPGGAEPAGPAGTGRRGPSNAAARAAGGGGSGRTYVLLPSQLETLQESEASRTIQTPKDHVNFLILGVDKLNTFSGNTDVMMLVSINQDDHSGLILSIPRDLCLESCDSWSSRINYVFASQGPVALLDTVSEMTGIKVDHYVAVHFGGFAKIIDVLGGVQVEADREFAERFLFSDGSSSLLSLRKGANQLSGGEALMYARSRKFDAAGDFARICRQQQLLAAVKSQALTPRTIVAAPTLFRQVQESIVTNFTLGELLSLLQTLASVSSDRIQSGVIAYQDNLVAPTRGSDGAYLLRPDMDGIREYVGGLQDQQRAVDPPAACVQMVNGGAAR